MTRAVFIGCVDFSARMLKHMLARDAVEMVGVLSRAESPFNADFRPLVPIAERHGIPALAVVGNDQDAMAGWIAERAPEVIFCIGWSYLLRPAVLDIAPLGVIGYHPALLPRNRGRHPIIWALALGLEKTGSTFFVMDEGADSGDIVSQIPVPIRADDDAASLYARLADTAVGQLDDIMGWLADGSLPRTPQDAALATNWRKRSREDGRIDWRMPARGVYNLVRALTRPYVGAHCLCRGEEVKVWRSRLCGTPEPDLEPGNVVALDDREIVVKCGDGAVALLEHEFSSMPKVGDYL